MSQSRLVFGFHAVLSCLKRAPSSVQLLYVDVERVDTRMREVLSLAKQNTVRVMAVPRQRLDGMSKGVHQGVLAQIIETTLPYQSLDDILQNEYTTPLLLLVLDGISDPHNLGACLRVADAFAVHAVIIPKDRAVSVNATVRKVACGAAETVPVINVTNLARALRQLQEAAVLVVGASSDAPATISHSALAGGALAVVLGAEGEGMRRLTAQHCDMLVRIPMLGSVQSLNVSVAAALCLYEVQRQRALAI